MSYKKFISIVLSVIIAVTCIPFAAVAEDIQEEPVNTYIPKEPLSVSAGIEALRGQFEPGVAPECEGYTLDYEFYSPVGKNDTNKYPVFIFLHGIGHGDYVGSQVDDSDMPYWSSKEFQERFDNAGGAFILMPRSPEQNNMYWGETLIDPLHALIEDFINNHKENVDTTRISISGSSAGGGMVWMMLDEFPEMFASAIPIASTKMPNIFEIGKTSETSIWLVSSSLDPIISYPFNTLVVWGMIKLLNDNRSNCRLSTFSKVTNPNGESSSDNHHLAGVITYDLHTLNDELYPYLETVDGNGNEVDLTPPNGLIKWISNTYSDYHGSPAEKKDFFLEDVINFFVHHGRNVVLFFTHIFQEILGL